MNDIIFVKYMTVVLRNQSRQPTTMKTRETEKKKEKKYMKAF